MFIFCRMQVHFYFPERIYVFNPFNKFINLAGVNISVEVVVSPSTSATSPTFETMDVMLSNADSKFTPTL